MYIYIYIYMYIHIYIYIYRERERVGATTCTPEIDISEIIVDFFSGIFRWLLEVVALVDKLPVLSSGY